MRLLRGIAGALLWVVSLVLLLVGAILCATVILLPIGIPLLGYARRAFTASAKLMLPRAVAHPVKTADAAVEKRGHKARKDATRPITTAKRDVAKIGKRGRKARRVRKKLPLVS
jgi:membrane protein implicated in regulation of membrane protease activity